MNCRYILLSLVSLFSMEIIKKHNHSAEALSILSWNVNGLRSFIKHDSAINNNNSILKQIIQRRNVDVCCLQETKIQESHVSELDQYLRLNYDINQIYWSCSVARKGYSGTAIIIFNTENTKNIKNLQVSYGIGDEIADKEGRVITLEGDNFTLINTYVPNSGDKLVRLQYRIESWDSKLASHINRLIEKRRDKQIPLILAGDLNVAHTHLDYYNSCDVRTRFQPGLTPEEQNSFTNKLLKECGLIDTFRTQYPDTTQYSWFNPRMGDKGRINRMGMRIDYILTTPVVPIKSSLLMPLSSTNVDSNIVGATINNKLFSSHHYDAYIEEEVCIIIILLLKYLLIFINTYITIYIIAL